MAIAMARAGGIGIVHRFLTVEQQVAEVARVKRAEALVIPDPHTIGPGARLSDARPRWTASASASLVVVHPGGPARRHAHPPRRDAPDRPADPGAAS